MTRDKQRTPVEPEPLVDPLLAAKVRGLRAQEALLEVAGGTLTTKDVATLLGGVGWQAVEQRRDGCTLLGLRMSGGAYVYPVCQFARGKVLPGLVRISAMSMMRFGPKRSHVADQVDQSFRVKAISA